MRFTPSDIVVGKYLNGFVANADQQMQLGARTNVVSYDYNTTAGNVNMGGGEAVYVRAQGTFAFGRMVHVDANWNILDVPITAGTGRPAYVCMQAFSATNQYGWVLRSGVHPALFSVAATVGPVYVGTAGNLTPTAAAGKQLLNATTLIAASGSFTRTVRTVNGSPRIICTAAEAASVYPGLTVSGTGMSGTVLSVDPDGRTITLSANCSAGGSVTATFTHTGYGIVHFEQPFIQGQIT